METGQIKIADEVHLRTRTRLKTWQATALVWQLFGSSNALAPPSLRSFAHPQRLHREYVHHSIFNCTFLVAIVFNVPHLQSLP